MFVKMFGCVSRFVIIFSVFIVKSDFIAGFKPLTPYVNQHGSQFSYGSIHECHKQQFGSAPHETFPAHHSPDNISSFYDVKRFVRVLKDEIGISRAIRGHYAIITDPLRTVSVLEPNEIGGCKLNIRQTVLETAKQKDCYIAINAGYFDTKSGKCHGNLVADGVIAVDSGGIQNAHFGIKKDGNIFTGYLSEEELLNSSTGFLQLVGGVVWIIKNGTGFVNASKYFECENTEETGPMDRFVDILSARTAVGHDAQGRVVIVQVDGKSGLDGVSLWEFQDLLKEFGLMNAINLDGGGSSTFVVNGVVANYPYDSCEDSIFACERKVSSVLCIHSPECKPKDCNGHGHCIKGLCECDTNWLPPRCDILQCGTSNCSGCGICSFGGCVCYSGYYGEDCEKSCPEGWFGHNCEKRCSCANNALCDPVTGKCSCRAGYMGDFCEHACPIGYYGNYCHNRCTCESACSCDRVNGSCNGSQEFKLFSECISQKVLRAHQSQMSDDKRKWLWVVVSISVIAAVSIASTVVLLFFSCFCHCKKKQCVCTNGRKHQYHHLTTLSTNLDLSGSSESEEIPFRVFNKS